jgi:photosystem II stability/assembly factor-like uncharacterized protein
MVPRHSSAPLSVLLGLVLASAVAAQDRSALAELRRGAVTSAEARLEAWRARRSLEAASPFPDFRWRPVGPRLSGGRIESIALSPASPHAYYVGAGAGNLWKTTNAGTTWTPIFDDQPTFSIGAVAVASTDPGIVWLGTGEILMARSSYAGIGVFRSTDGGASWEHMGLAETHHIGRVLIHPRDPDVVYVAAMGHLFGPNPERGLFRTTDGGRTWDKVLYVSEHVGVVDVVMDPTDPRALWAVAWEQERRAWNHRPAGVGSGLHRSDDGGDTWRRVRGGLPEGEHVGRMAVAVAPTDPSRLYVLVDNQAPAPDGEGVVGGEVYRSDDGGRRWRKINEEPLPARIGYDFNLIRVAPDDPEQVWVTGNYLLRSDDGGRTFGRNEGTLVHLLPHASDVLHLDHHELVLDSDDPDRVLLGNDGGLHVSYDRGASWLHLNNLPITEFYDVSVDSGVPYRIYGGTQDNAALVGASGQTIRPDGPDHWEQIYLDRWGGGDSYFTYPDRLDPDLVYYEHQFGELRRKDVARDTTVNIKPEPPGDEPLRTNWMTPFVISHHNPLTLYYGARRLYRSVDRGDRWWPMSPDLTGQPEPERQGNIPFGTLTTIAESRLDPRLLYVGADDGAIHVTDDGGIHWRRIDGPLPDKWVTRVEASRHDPDVVYASLTGYREDDFATYVFASDDRGRTWRSLAGNLPAEPVNVILEDPHDPAILFLGTDLGVFVTLDGGGRWEALGTGLPTTPVHDLEVHPEARELVAGTHGRSVFVADLAPVYGQSSREGG